MMDDYGMKLTYWLIENYGYIGALIISMTMLAAFVLVLYLLSLIPEPKEIPVSSKCLSCRYKHKKLNYIVSECRQYEQPRWIQFRSPPCPKNDYISGCAIIKSQSDSAFFKREDLPDGFID